MLRRSFKNIQKIYAIRSFRTTACSLSKDNKEGDDSELSSSVATRFQVFKNESVGIIFDIEEERAKRRLQQEMGITDDDADDTHYESRSSAFEGINLERGLTGVFEIEDLVQVLRRENAIDLFVVKIPKELAYVDYMCIVTGSTNRHMLGMANFVRKVYKMKRNPSDPVPKIEGKDCKSWMCLDLGNIALHIFSKKAREQYSLETLWTLGEEYEKRTKPADIVEDIYEEFLNTSEQVKDVSDNR